MQTDNDCCGLKYNKHNAFTIKYQGRKSHIKQKEKVVFSFEINKDNDDIMWFFAARYLKHKEVFTEIEVIISSTARHIDLLYNFILVLINYRQYTFVT